MMSVRQPASHTHTQYRGGVLARVYRTRYEQQICCSSYINTFTHNNVALARVHCVTFGTISVFDTGFYSMVSIPDEADDLFVCMKNITTPPISKLSKET